MKARAPHRYAFAAIVLALAAACSAKVDTAAGPPADAVLASALQADKDFAAAAKKDGLKAAFLAWFEPEGEFIDSGGRVSGAAKIAEGFAQAPPSFMIEWTPDGAKASAAGDFAFTTGRYVIKVGDQVGEQGRYVSLWRKDAAGAWKVTTQAVIVERIPSSQPDPQGRPG